MTVDLRMRTEHESIIEVLAAADRSGLILSRVEMDGRDNIRVELGGDYGMHLVLEGPSRRVAGYLNRIHAFGSGPFDVKP